jgi:hypothetical protein
MTATRGQCSCKVGRTIERYDLAGTGDAIIRRREEDDESLRALAEFVNTRVLRRAIERHAGRDVLADPASLLSRLTGGDDAGKTAETHERLRAAGVPIDRVTDDFVSHQTVRSHLNGCLDMETGRSPATDVEDVANLIEWARTRDEEVIDRAIARLRESEEFDIGDTNVIHSVRVICEDCGESHRVQELLDAGGCACQDASTA